MLAVASSVRLPSASNFCAAPPIITSGLLSTRASRNTKHCRRWYCMRAVPSRPGEAPMIATGLSANGWSGARDAQSIAFLSTPGTE